MPLQGKEIQTLCNVSWKGEIGNPLKEMYLFKRYWIFLSKKIKNAFLSVKMILSFKETVARWK